MSLRVTLTRLTLLTAVMVPACASPRLEGPPQDLHALATPEPLPVVRPAPPVAAGRWRAWVPPQTTSAGDRIDGHWLDLPLAPPQVEELAPTAPMPRTPKTPSPAAKPAAPLLRLPNALRQQVPGLLPEEGR